MKSKNQVELKVVGMPSFVLPDGSPHPGLTRLIRFLAKHAVKKAVDEHLASLRAGATVETSNEERKFLWNGDERGPEDPGL